APQPAAQEPGITRIQTDWLRAYRHNDCASSLRSRFLVRSSENGSTEGNGGPRSRCSTEQQKFAAAQLNRPLFHGLSSNQNETEQIFMIKPRLPHRERWANAVVLNWLALSISKRVTSHIDKITCSLSKEILFHCMK